MVSIFIIIVDYLIKTISIIVQLHVLLLIPLVIVSWGGRQVLEQNMKVKREQKDENKTGRWEQNKNVRIKREGENRK